jgi:hypothetical protein
MPEMRYSTDTISATNSLTEVATVAGHRTLRPAWSVQVFVELLSTSRTKLCSASLH